MFSASKILLCSPKYMSWPTELRDTGDASRKQLENKRPPNYREENRKEII